MVVVRLKGGDPAVFGRSAEEAEALQVAGVPFEMVPGVTAGLAAAAYAGIPVTHADHASAVALVTGQERHCKQGPPLDYGALADFPGTLVFYMGVTSARQWSQALIGRGKPAGTPAAIVRRCTRSDQVVIPCTLADLGEVIERKGIRPPAVILVGEAVAAAPQQWWFTARPLLGTRVLVTRPRHQADALAGPLAGLGAEVLFQPAIEISEPADWRPVDRVIARIQEFDWLVFSSANGVCYFLDRLLQGGDLRRLGNTRLAAIGPGTAEELARFRLRPDVVPQEHRAEALAAALSKGAADRRFLLIRASRGREVLAEDLTAAGGHVDQVVVYQSRDVEQADPQIAAALTDGQISWITVTSSAIAQSLARLFGESLRRARLASISPITSETLRKLGFEPAAEATVYTMEGVVKAIRRSLELLSPGDPTHIA
jgi:uroporphyrinogen III methyltransferase/synthase